MQLVIDVLFAVLRAANLVRAVISFTMSQEAIMPLPK